MTAPLVALTGSTGFIGRHLLTALAARGYRVRVLLRRPVDLPPGISGAVVGDLARPQNMAAALSGADAVVHSAGLAHAMSGAPEDDYRTLQHRGDAGSRAGRRPRPGAPLRVPVLDPGAVRPLRRRRPHRGRRPAPTDAYGRSKLAAEEALAGIDIDYAALRRCWSTGRARRATWRR